MEEPFDFHKPNFDMAKAARRFEYGSSSVAGIYAFNAALGLLLDTGIPRIEKRVIELADRLERGLLEKGMEILSPRREGEKSGIISFRHPVGGRDYEAYTEDLQKRKIVVSARGGGVRVSPHFYNNEDDIDAFLEALS